MAQSNEDRVRVGVISMGAMGAGIAALLVSHGYHVATNIQGRSEDTRTRARRAGVEEVSSDEQLVHQCRVILSIVPPDQAQATAERVLKALASREDGQVSGDTYFVDLNAVAPSTIRTIQDLFANGSSGKGQIKLIDGCILGGPPKRSNSVSEAKGSGDGDDAGDPSAVTDKSEETAKWYRPRIPVSGPHNLNALPGGHGISELLQFRSMSPDIGAASGLKMCFAAVSKGLNAIFTQSLSTAHSLGIVLELKDEMRHLFPALLDFEERVGPGMPPKAYRWVAEMQEIAKTFSEDGGWSRATFDGAAEVFQEVADNEVLGKETTENRVRGTDLDDLAKCMAEGLEKKKRH